MSKSGVITSVLDLIGHTPIVELSRVHRGSGRVLAKCEFLNPGGSMKDRAALRIVREAEADGRLKPGSRPCSTVRLPATGS